MAVAMRVPQLSHEFDEALRHVADDNRLIMPGLAVVVTTRRELIVCGWENVDCSALCDRCGSTRSMAYVDVGAAHEGCEAGGTWRAPDLLANQMANIAERAARLLEEGEALRFIRPALRLEVGAFEVLGSRARPQ